MTTQMPRSFLSFLGFGTYLSGQDTRQPKFKVCDCWQTCRPTSKWQSTSWHLRWKLDIEVGFLKELWLMTTKLWFADSFRVLEFDRHQDTGGNPAASDQSGGQSDGFRPEKVNHDLCCPTRGQPQSHKRANVSTYSFFTMTKHKVTQIQLSSVHFEMP